MIQASGFVLRTAIGLLAADSGPLDH